VTWPPATKRSRSCDRQSENLPQNKLPTQALDHERGNRQRQRGKREQLQQGLATPAREPPPQTGRKRDDDHDRADVGAHLNPPSSQMQCSQTRRRRTRREGGPHAAEVWPPTPETAAVRLLRVFRSDAVALSISRYGEGAFATSVHLENPLNLDGDATAPLRSKQARPSWRLR
jgi:hypothetical protein